MSHLSFFLVSLTILMCSLPTIVDANNLIQQTCKNCSKSDPNISYKFCTTSLQSDRRSHCAKNLTQLGLISMKLTRHNISDTYDHIQRLLKKNIDPFVKECLDDCLEVYSDAITTLREAIRDYRAKRYADANVKLSSVLDAPTTCEDGFKQKNHDHVSSPLTKRNKNAFQLSAIALSIVNMLNADKLKGIF